jgi:hypothetical protein
MKPIAALILALTIAGCASPEDVAGYAAQTCEPMKPHGATEYDRCVVETTRHCREIIDTGKGMAGACKPKK